MARLQQSERSIGRGEVAESRIEAPFFAFFMVLCAVGLFAFHVVFQDQNLTLALAISMLVFGGTIIRVQFGIFILIAAMLLSPEIEAGAVGASNERGINLRYDDVLIIIIFLGVLVKLAFEGEITFWRANPINAGIFAYLAVCILSTLLAWRISVPAWDRSVAFFVILKMIEFYMVFFMVGLVADSGKDIRRYLVVFFAVSLVVCVYGISSIGSLDRVSAPFEAGGTEPNTLGGYLMIVMCVAVGLYLYAPTIRLKLALAGVGAIAFIPFIMTLSRASYVSLFVAMLAIGVFGRRFSILAMVAVLLALSPFYAPQEVKDRIYYTFQPSGVPVTVAGVETDIRIDKSTYERIYVWEKVRYNLGVWPWFGGGVSWDTVLDSQYARVIIETGIFGAAAFAFMLFRMLRTSREAYRWSRDWVAKGLSLAMLATTLGLMVHSLGTISFLIVRIMEPFWFLMALVGVARAIAIRDHNERLQEYREAALLEAERAEAEAQVVAGAA